jgi:hypothetical protein
MKMITIVGIILIVIGLIALIYGGIAYTSSKNVVDMGSMQVQVEQQRQIPLSPIAGAASLVVGVVLIFVGRRRPALA